jgi:hypothetical protein
MHPITALMLSQQMEEERRRKLGERRHRFLAPEHTAAGEKRASWIDRIRAPRFGLAGS